MCRKCDSYQGHHQSKIIERVEKTTELCSTLVLSRKMFYVVLMNLVQSVKTCFKKYLVIDGRASRSEYWWFLLFAGFTPLIIILILAFFLSGEESNNFYNTLVLIIFIPFIIPLITVSIRRLHDLGKSCEIFIVLIILELILSVEVVFQVLNSNFFMIINFASWVLTVYFFIIFMFKGSNKKNKYGNPIKL